MRTGTAPAKGEPGCNRGRLQELWKNGRCLFANTKGRKKHYDYKNYDIRRRAPCRDRAARLRCAAEVVLEHQREARPAFRVQVRVEVPGPGIHAKATRHTRQAALLIHGPALHAEARDNTLEAALLKATQDLEHQLQARQLRRMERGKSKLQLSAISGRWTRNQAGRRA